MGEIKIFYPKGQLSVTDLKRNVAKTQHQQLRLYIAKLFFFCAPLEASPLQSWSKSQVSLRIMKFIFQSIK